MKTYPLFLLLALLAAFIPPEPAAGQMVLANYHLGETEDILSDMMADYADSEWAAYELSERHAAHEASRDPEWGWMLDRVHHDLIALEFTSLPAAWAEVECGIALYEEINACYEAGNYSQVNALFPSMEASRDRLVDRRAECAALEVVADHFLGEYEANATPQGGM